MIIQHIQKMCFMSHVHHGSLSIFADSSMYAHFLFEAFDTNKNGSVSFEVSLCLISDQICQICTRILFSQNPNVCPDFLGQDFVFGLSIILRGTVNDRLNWAFNLYDLNKDGCITKEVNTQTHQGKVCDRMPE